MASNMKGWIGFLVITVIIIGGAFGTSQLIPTQASGTSIKGIASSGGSGFYNASNQTYTANVSDTTTNISFTMTITDTTASGAMNLTVIAPNVLNLSAYNSTYSAIYDKLYNQTLNQTEKSGITLNSSVNSSIAQNVSRQAESYTYQNITYQMFQSFTKNVTYSGGQYEFNFTLQLNTTALKLMVTGQSLFVVINAAAGSDSSNGFILLSKQ